ncbi:hypothetical protein KTE19_10525 [Lentilactobacillus sp. IMAU92037]|uniref:hypothetical protein n=1 Tax=Lentilactobacillus TaxID=2767893 RepID=UPI001C2C31F1|nr:MULTISPECIES: hypothetical protein [Lentilactobacillus]MBV0931123.1 hypothetical protein [Lentilactobacillus dabitei]MDM7515358.1 hypothetical protein [Lentilactobacillus sp. TOM.63]
MNTETDNIDTLTRMTPVKVLSQNMSTIAQAIDDAATDGNQQQVLQLVDSAESLLKAISKLNQ